MKKLALFVAVSALSLLLAACGTAATNVKTPAPALTANSVTEILKSAAADSETDVPQFDENPVMDAPEIIETPSGQDSESGAESVSAHDGIDVDLTQMSATMVYGQVSGMMYTPEEYVGKTIRMRGPSYSSYYDETDTTYYSILIADATACCAQGLEYELSDVTAYPEDETEVTVTGVFELYDELGVTYCRLKNAAVME